MKRLYNRRVSAMSRFYIPHHSAGAAGGTSPVHPTRAAEPPPVDK